MANFAKQVDSNADVTFYVEPSGRRSVRVAIASSDHNGQLRTLCHADLPMPNAIAKAVHCYFGQSKPTDTYKIVDMTPLPSHSHSHPLSLTPTRHNQLG